MAGCLRMFLATFANEFSQLFCTMLLDDMFQTLMRSSPTRQEFLRPLLIRSGISAAAPRSVDRLMFSTKFWKRLFCSVKMPSRSRLSDAKIKIATDSDRPELCLLSRELASLKCTYIGVYLCMHVWVSEGLYIPVSLWSDNLQLHRRVTITSMWVTSACRQTEKQSVVCSVGPDLRETADQAGQPTILRFPRVVL